MKKGLQECNSPTCTLSQNGYSEESQQLPKFMHIQFYTWVLGGLGICGCMIFKKEREGERQGEREISKEILGHTQFYTCALVGLGICGCMVLKKRERERERERDRRRDNPKDLSDHWPLHPPSRSPLTYQT